MKITIIYTACHFDFSEQKGELTFIAPFSFCDIETEELMDRCKREARRASGAKIVSVKIIGMRQD